MKRRLILFALLGGFLFLQLGSRGLNEPDEGRYVEIAREMLVSGDWVLPRLKAVPHYTKPPMTYWSVAASLRCFGFNEFAARLPSTLAALLTLVATFRIARRFGDERYAWLSVGLLLSCVEFFALARIVTTDMLLCMSCSIAFAAALEAPRRAAQIVFWLALAFGVLTKGPIALMVVGLTLIGRALWLRRWPALGWSFGPLLFALAVFPWFWAITRREPLLLDYWLGEEVVGRVSQGLKRSKPWFYFLIVGPITFIPMTLLVPLAAWIEKRRSNRSVTSASSDPSPHVGGWGLGMAAPQEGGAAAQDRDSDVAEGRSEPSSREGSGGASMAALLLPWLLLPFLVFTLASSKLWTYLLPLAPALALAAALVLRPWVGRRPRVFVIVFVIWMTLLQGVLVMVKERELELGNNASFAAFAAAIEEGLAGEVVVGARLPDDIMLPETGPDFDASGLALVSYKLRFQSAGFYLLERRPRVRSLLRPRAFISAHRSPTPRGSPPRAS